MSDPAILKNITDAIDRIARTPDGVSLYLYCQRKVMSVARSPDPDTLRQEHGERRFALELIGLLTRGLIESGGRPSISGTGDDQPVVFKSPEPIAGPALRGVARRGLTGSVPGWDPPKFDDAS